MFGRTHLGAAVIQPLRSVFTALPNGALPATAGSGQSWVTPATRWGGVAVPVRPAIQSGAMVANSNAFPAVALITGLRVQRLTGVVQPFAGASEDCFLCPGAFIDPGSGDWARLSAGVTGGHVPFLEADDHFGGVVWSVTGAAVSPPVAGDTWATAFAGSVLSLLINGVVVVSGTPPAEFVGTGTAGAWFNNLLPAVSPGFSQLSASGFAVYP